MLGAVVLALAAAVVVGLAAVGLAAVVLELAAVGLVGEDIIYPC
jgi:hypothetical protein